MEFIKRNLIWRNEMKSYRKIIPGIRLDCFMTVSSNAKQKAWIPQRKIKKLLLFTPKSHYFPISFHQSPCSFNPAQTLFNISLFVTFWWKLENSIFVLMFARTKKPWWDRENSWWARDGTEKAHQATVKMIHKLKINEPFFRLYGEEGCAMTRF